MYVPRGSTVNETPSEGGNASDDVIIIRRGANRTRRGNAAAADTEDEVASAEAEPRRESLGARILKAPFRAVGRFANNIRRHPINSALNFLSITGLLAVGHHLGLTRQVANLAPEGFLRTAANKPGEWSHQMWGFGLDRAATLTPGWVNTPARAFLTSTNNLLGPR